MFSQKEEGKAVKKEEWMENQYIPRGVIGAEILRPDVLPVANQ